MSDGPMSTFLMTVSAVLLASCGVILVFAPAETAVLLGSDPGGAIAFSLWGSALFGIGALNWVARQARIGGIYGRSVVAGNQAHAFVGTLVLVRFALEAGLTWFAGMLLGVYLLHAVVFSYLLISSTGLE